MHATATLHGLSARLTLFCAAVMQKLSPPKQPEMSRADGQRDTAVAEPTTAYAARLGLLVARGHPNVLFEKPADGSVDRCVFSPSHLRTFLACFRRTKPHRSPFRLVVPMTTKSGEHYKGANFEDGCGNCCGQGGGGCCAFGGGGFSVQPGLREELVSRGSQTAAACEGELREELLSRGGQTAVAAWDEATSLLQQGLVRPPFLRRKESCFATHFRRANDGLQAGRCCVVGNCLLGISVVGIPILCCLEASRQSMLRRWIARTNETLFAPLGMWAKFQSVGNVVHDSTNNMGGSNSHQENYAWMAVSLTAEDAFSLKREPVFWANDYGVPCLYFCTCSCETLVGSYCCEPCMCCCFEKRCV